VFGDAGGQRQLTIGFGVAFTDAKLTDNFCKIDNSPDCTVPLLGPDGQPVLDDEGEIAVPNEVLAPDGQRLPYSARWKGNLNARYEWAMGDWQPYLQGNLSWQTDSLNDLRTADRAITGTRSGYQIVDLAAGAKKDVWTFELFAQNVFDAAPDLYRYAQCAVQVCGGKLYTYTFEPRTVGFRVGRRF